ncbi:MAG: bifunctional 2-C-methyl-D-erythritol 4-phosphate cytidylyltransferase/2-C-methyl-D-erythritol 2,4-cyclodiphosphate synthase [Pseudomonadota bacterium]
MTTDTRPKAPKTAAVIVAAGRGQRAGAGVPKQWRRLAGATVAAHTMSAFARHAGVDLTVLVHHPDDTDYLAALPPHVAVPGGVDRAASVLAGLRAAEAHGADWVLVHDIARPGVSAEVIDRVLSALATAPAAAPALAVTDALWRGADGAVGDTVSRDGLFRAQTPQGFHLAPLLAAHAAHPGGATDDVEVARAAGLDVAIVAGDEANLKITTPEDFARAEAILKGADMSTPLDVRLGNGYDVHKFGPGDAVILCGVRVPHTHGLVGHSDADVGMHAVTDAIYGALADGDIGQHFPPSDPQWKGAASEIFLKHAVARATERGYRIGNIDCTLVCEFPKIGPVAAEMRAEMARLMGLEIEQVSVKATTSEKLGFTGRGEGIASIATATLVRG